MTISNVSNGAAAMAAASMQEATETAAQTKAEAAKGDRQAIRRMARSQESQAAASTPPPASATGGLSRALDVHA